MSRAAAANAPPFYWPVRNPWPLLFAGLALTGLALLLASRGGGAWSAARVGLVVAGLIFVVMTTWKRGSRITFAREQDMELSHATLIERIKSNPPARIPGTAVFLSANPIGAPAALLANLQYNGVMHEHVLLTTVRTGGPADWFARPASERELLELLAWLEQERGLAREAAYVLMSVAAELRVTEAVDAPNALVSAALPLEVFEDLAEAR